MSRLQTLMRTWGVCLVVGGCRWRRSLYGSESHGCSSPCTQAEPRAALSLAANEASSLLRLSPSDLLLYSAKIIPGNDTRVVAMMNSIARIGPEIAMARGENLHTSGHAYRRAHEWGLI